MRKLVTKMKAERIVKTSRDNLSSGRKSPGHPKIRWGDLIPG